MSVKMDHPKPAPRPARVSAGRREASFSRPFEREGLLDPAEARPLVRPANLWSGGTPASPPAGSGAGASSANTHGGFGSGSAGEAGLNFRSSFSSIPVLAGGRPAVQATLAVGHPGDEYEQEAERVAGQVAGLLQGGLIEGDPNELAAGVGGRPARQKRAGRVRIQARPAPGRSLAGLTPALETEIVSLRGRGHPLPAGERRLLERPFGHDFSSVRIHTDERAGRLARALGAHAFTAGRDIVFASGQYRPGTGNGRRLLAHELAHVVQQAAAPPHVPAVQRDLAVEPPNPTAVAPELTEDQIAEAIRYNEFRFQDPFTVRIIRDVLGLAPVPAIVDEAFVRAVAQWQAEYNMTPDGKVGPGTTRTLIGELRAEGQPAAVEQLRLDNFVSTFDVLAPTYRIDTGAAIQHFEWHVGFRTSLRNGFIIQRIDNEFVPAMCNGSAYTAWRPTPRYWEAWEVDGAGRVTPAVGTVNDMWTRPFAPASSGRWRMTGTCFTVLRLPPAAGFAAGNVPDAGILQSTTTAPNPDDLGLVAGRRTIGGDWNFCAPTNTHVRR